MHSFFEGKKLTLIMNDRVPVILFYPLSIRHNQGTNGHVFFEPYKATVQLTFYPALLCHTSINIVLDSAFELSLFCIQDLYIKISFLQPAKRSNTRISISIIPTPFPFYLLSHFHTKKIPAFYWRGFSDFLF